MGKQKIYKFIVFFVITILLTFTACSCAKKDDSSSDEEEVRYTRQLLCDFESEREMTSVVYRNYYGKIEICDDEEYVTSGEKCAKFSFRPGVSDIRIAILPGTKYCKKLDFTDTLAIELDAYNASDEDIEVCFSYGANVFTVLKAGKNHLIFPIKRTAIDVSGPSDISLYIKGVDSAEQEKQYVIYMDNLVAVTEKNSVSVGDIDYSDGYLFDDENIVYNSFLYMGSSESIFNRPRYSLNRDTKYILSGSGSMKVEFFPLKNGGGVSTLGFRTINGTNMLKWNAYDYDSAYISADLFNANNVDLDIRLAVFTATNNSIQKSFTVKANSWSKSSESKILLRDILNLDVTENLDIMTIVVFVSGMEPSGGVIYLDNISIKTI